MIKKLHYVWFGGKKKPQSVMSYIESWRKFCPEWEIIEWNEETFDTQRYRWVREALSVQRYAFAADFVRLWVLSVYGGGIWIPMYNLLRI